MADSFGVELQKRLECHAHQMEVLFLEILDQKEPLQSTKSYYFLMLFKKVKNLTIIPNPLDALMTLSRTVSAQKTTFVFESWNCRASSTKRFRLT